MAGDGRNRLGSPPFPYPPTRLCTQAPKNDTARHAQNGRTARHEHATRHGRAYTLTQRPRPHNSAPHLLTRTTPSHASDTGTHRDPPSDMRTITHRSRRLANWHEYAETFSPANTLQQTTPRSPPRAAPPTAPRQPAQTQGHARTQAHNARAHTTSAGQPPAPRTPTYPTPHESARAPIVVPAARQAIPRRRDGRRPSLETSRRTIPAELQHPIRTQPTHTPHPQTLASHPQTPIPSLHHHQPSVSFASPSSS